MYKLVFICLLFSVLFAEKLWLTDQWESSVYDVLLTTNSESLYKFKADFPITSMSVDPNLPDGLKLHNDGSLTGIPEFPLNRTQYQFSANHGTATIRISISILECETGVKSIISISPTSIFNLALNSDLVYTGSVTNSIVLCLEKGTYEYNTTMNSFLNLRVSTNDMIILQRNFYSPDAGTFTIGEVSTSPSISMSSFLPVVSSPSSLPLTIQGSFSRVRIHPAACVQYNFATGSLAFNCTSAGLFPYTITVSNALGFVTRSFTVGVDTCPENTERISIVSIASSMFEFDIMDEEGALIKHNSKSFFCVKHNMNYSFDLNHYNAHTDYMFYFRDQLGTLLEYPPYPRVVSSLALKDVIPPSASWRFTNTEEANWMEVHYSDTHWKEGKQGGWGDFTTSKKAFFRKTFTVDLSEMQTSFLHLTLSTDTIAIVYVNGKWIGQVNPLDALQHRLTVPYAFLKGENLLAVELQQTTHPAILFDLNAFVVTSPSVTLSVGGEVKEEQQTIDPQHAGKYAFDDDVYSHWKTTSYPASVEYIFAGNRAQIVNTLSFVTSDDRIKTLHIEGVKKDGSKTALFSIASNSMEMEETFFFDNETPFSSYRILIENSLKNGTVNVHHLRLMQINPLFCPDRDGITHALVGSSYFTQCPSGRVGRAKLTCLQKEKNAVWEEDTTGCVPRRPSAGIVFIDSVLTIRSAKPIEMEFVEKIPSVFFRYLRIQYPEYNTTYIADLSNAEGYQFEVGIRLTLDPSLGEYVYKSLMKQLDEIEKALVKLADWRVYFEREPVLRKPFNWVCGCVIAALCILMFIVVVLSVVCIQRGKLIKKLQANAQLLV